MAQFSGDGRWIVYRSDASGTYEVYVRPYPPRAGGQQRISDGGGTDPVWAPDDRTLFYIDANFMMTATPVDQVTGAVREASRELFPGLANGGFSSVAPAPVRRFDVMPDGERFVMLMLGALDEGRDEIVTVQNWFTELERLVPTD